MRIRALLSPLLACCCKHRPAAGLPEFMSKDYTNFAKMGTVVFSDLEEHVLDPPYENSLVYTCPELPPSVIAARVPHINANEKAQSVVFMALTDYAWPTLLEQNLIPKCGYAAHLLLRKLFHRKYILSLKLRVLCTTVDRLVLAQHVAKSAARLAAINGCVEAALLDEIKLGIPELAVAGGARNSAVDLIIHMLRMMGGLGSGLLATATPQLLGILAADAGSRDKMLPLVRDTVRIAQQLDLFCATAQREMREHIFQFVADNNERVYFSLFNGFITPHSVSTCALAYVRGKKYEDVPPHFIRNYVDHVNAELDGAEVAVEQLFEAFMPRFSDFHTSDTLWRSDPEFFNAIPCKWLSAMFNDLHDNAAAHLDLEELMRWYMSRLYYPEFIRILKTHEEQIRLQVLAIFMLKYQSEESGSEYKALLRRSISNNAANEQLELVYAVLAPLYGM
ncbi:hypothetical protein PAPHI01_0312 [Pancytospora philotis]|nr:hypothetical protein PAPHI01_0312 [Pancytospora philotis]